MNTGRSSRYGRREGARSAVPGRLAIMLGGCVLGACAGDGESVPSGVTPNLLSYDRATQAPENVAYGLEERVTQLSVMLEMQRQRIAQQAVTISRLRDAGKMRGQSIASLKKEQLAAEARRAGERRALDAEIAGLRQRLDGLQTRLEAMSEAIDTAAGVASQARLTANRRAAERMRDAGDPVAGDIAAGQTYGMHLASYRTDASAQQGWSELQARHEDVLSGLEMRLATLNLDSLGGAYQRLLAGPFASVDAARAACEQLRPRDQFCQVTVYGAGGAASEGE